ncbi:MAG: succinate dehydrogenase, cytochrome b556 subunit [Xanthomonadaceae bacterium]|jgi:succinate dehydrogenase / fumarate reductase cytochrome b subunit|nr:succinate dehydrogenase, cytochrome b556 subunit [Xanthomonadaceae bacterium]
MTSRDRPLSPHLQVYRWQIQMATSILHRATGIILALGALLIAAAMVALMRGREAWECVSGFTHSWLGIVILVGWTWSFAYHLCNGIRHIFQDFTYGFSIPTLVRNSWLSIIGSFVLTALVWGYVLVSRGTV